MTLPVARARMLNRIVHRVSEHHPDSDRVVVCEDYGQRGLSVRGLAYVRGRWHEMVNLTDVTDELSPNAVWYEARALGIRGPFCKHCGDKLKPHHALSGFWVSNDNQVLPQYCWLDPSFGSQLHEP